MIARVSWCLILCRFHDKRHENGTKMTAWCSREVCAFTRCCSRHRKHFSSKFSNVTITHSAPGIICCDRQLRAAIDFPDWCNNTIAMFLFLHTISHFHLTPSHLSHWVVAATNHLTARWKHIHHFCVYKQQRQQRRQRLGPRPSKWCATPAWRSMLESALSRESGESSLARSMKYNLWDLTANLSLPCCWNADT